MKKWFAFLLIFAFIFVSSISVIFALNCGGASFVHESDYGTFLPYDDLRGKTETYLYNHGGIYSNFATAYVKLVDNQYWIEAYTDGVDVINRKTGWITLTGRDHGYVTHLAMAECYYDGCEGYNTLNITVYE